MESLQFRPIFFRPDNASQKEELEQLLLSPSRPAVHDEIHGQLRELVKASNPSRKLNDHDYQVLISEHLNGKSASDYGVWVYYPWLNCVVHTLDEREFVSLRTNRNRYKITDEEQKELSQKVIGVVGLSVGHSIALTLATERICGELRLADMDTIELSNLNRIRTGLNNLGLNKAVMAAREIAQLDPFLKVNIFTDGINKDNIDSFFTENGKLDLLVEVCDGLDVKILSRYKARELRIPVVMDTNDRGMLDIERFDLEPDRKILHGLAGDLDPEKLQSLSNEDKVPYILQMVGADDISPRLKASMIEVEQTINTWPQLASSVTLGGAITTDICRRILLDQFHGSGRYYVDLDEIVKEPKAEPEQRTEGTETFAPLSFEEIKRRLELYKVTGGDGELVDLTEEQRNGIAHAAHMAPSAGNNQPWKWYVKDSVFYLFHDKRRSLSWGDFNEIGAYAGLGCAIENVYLKALELGLEAVISYPETGDKQFIAVIRFRARQKDDSKLNELSQNLEIRHTNRMNGERIPLEQGFYDGLSEIISTIPGAEIRFVTDAEQMELLGEVISGCDRLRLLDRRGHTEFFHEVRWSREEARQPGDGIDILLADVSQAEVAGFRMATDWNAIDLVSKWDKGQAFRKMSRKAVAAASGIGLVLMPSFDYFNFINVGRAVERGWIYANMQGVSIHPMLSPVFFFNMLKHGEKALMSGKMREELEHIRDKYERVFDLRGGKAELFLMKLAKAPEARGKSHRLPFDQIFYFD
jgi:molybdopterin/thiamine biosynthesis adenylyltransferase